MTALAGVSKVLAAVPNKVIIEGHTDNQPLAGGKYPSNWELSVARAYSVIEYFSKEKGISPERFIAAGYGEYRPVASNETLEGRAQNRRIEIVLLRKSDG
jgi:chemotaxis protein MotB